MMRARRVQHLRRPVSDVRENRIPLVLFVLVLFVLVLPVVDISSGAVPAAVGAALCAPLSRAEREEAGQLRRHNLLMINCASV
jgi:hypothetical protein